MVTPTAIPAGIHLPTSAANTLDGELIPSTFLAAESAFEARFFIAENNLPAAPAIPLIIPDMMCVPTLPQLTALNALNILDAALFALLHMRLARLTSPDITAITIRPPILVITPQADLKP